ncbi:MAG: Mrp/NBP35 family ATP-binding protein [Anaerolineae bacterium]
MASFGKQDGSIVDESQVLQALGTVIEPELHRDLVTLNMVSDVQVDGGTVDFKITLTTPACPLQDLIERDAREAVMKVPGVEVVNVRFDASVPRDNRLFDQIQLRVGNAVAVASGKGGVGKSTVAANLAVSIARDGASVGLLDADIYGPNIPLMLGAKGQRPRVMNEKIQPVEAYGVKIMSMAFLVEEEQPIIWRGPMLHGAIRQFLTDVDWGELDYLIVDLPPGTGDAQLSLAQSLPLTGGVVVTTPQDVALADVIKGIAMFKQLKVPVLGVIENMSYFIAPDTGNRYEIFGHGGGQKVAERMGVPFLGEIPIDPRVREGGDAGQPIVVAAPDSPAGQALRDIGQNLAAKISILHLTRETFEPSVELRVVQ